MKFTDAQLEAAKQANRKYAKLKMQKQRKQIQENIWHKLFMLQNYTLSMDMFKGSTMRWKTICTYAWFIRQIYQGKFDAYKTKVSYTKSMLDYVQGLIDSGVEPYPSPNTENKIVSIKYLIDNQIITPYQIKQIYEPVSTMDNLPDTSVSCSREYGLRNDHEHDYTGVFYKIVPEEIKQTVDNVTEAHIINRVTNPISNQIFNPFKVNNNKSFNLAEMFKQIF